MAIEESKLKIDLLSFIEKDSGHKAKHIGGYKYKINPCPICGHKDHFLIYTDSNSYSSFNDCCKGGSIVDYFIEVKKMNKLDAIKEVNKLAGSETIQLRNKPETSSNNQTVVKKYNFTNIVKELNSNLKDTDYFNKRGLGELSLNSGIVFGYDKLGYNHALRNSNELKNFIKDTKGQFIEKAYRYFIFLMDKEGVCRYFIARRDDDYIVNMDAEQRDKYPKTLNLKKLAGTPELTNERYLHDETLTDDCIFITESWGDAASIELLGFKAIGTNSAVGYKKTAELIEKNKDFLRRKAFILAGNNDSHKDDNTGQNAIKKLEILFKKLNINYINIVPPFNDFNQWLIEDKSKMEAILKKNVSELLSLDPKEIEINEEDDIDILEYNFSDVGNAERLIKYYGNVIKYNVTDSKDPWLIWNGKQWKKDKCEQIHIFARKIIKRIQRAGDEIESVDKESISYKKQVRSFVLRSENDSRLKAMVNQAKSFEGIPLQEDLLDVNKYSLNCQNGTVNLKTGELLEHKKDDLITKIIPVNYDPKAKCPEWLTFLNRIFLKDTELIDYIQTAVGYTLTGLTIDQSFFMLYGTGSNGKSTFLSVLKYILGDYSISLKGSSLMVKRNDEGARGDLAKLQGTRFVWVSELNENQVFDESLVKSLTGGEDPIAVRFLYGEEFSLQPQFKLWMGTNNKPVIKGADDGMWRRVRLIPFEYKFPDAEKDRDFFKNKLLPEMAGILNWCIEGCLRLEESGKFNMNTPEKVRAAIQKYKNDMDEIQQFIDECCIIDKKCFSKADQLYRAYQTWCISAGESEMKGTMFGKKLTEKGFLKKRMTIGIFYEGIGIQSDMDPDKKESDLIEIKDGVNPFC